MIINSGEKGEKMKPQRAQIAQVLTLFVLMLFLFAGYSIPLAQDAGTSRVIFYVK